MQTLLKQYAKKQELRDKYLALIIDEKETLVEESKRTGRTIEQIQQTRSSFMRLAMDRQKDMDKIANKIEELK